MTSDLPSYKARTLLSLLNEKHDNALLLTRLQRKSTGVKAWKARLRYKLSTLWLLMSEISADVWLACYSGPVAIVKGKKYASSGPKRATTAQTLSGSVAFSLFNQSILKNTQRRRRGRGSYYVRRSFDWRTFHIYKFCRINKIYIGTLSHTVI